MRRRIADDLAVDDSHLVAAGRRLLSPAAWRAFWTEQRALIHDLPALERRLGQISAPTTIVAGSADRIVLRLRRSEILVPSNLDIDGTARSHDAGAMTNSGEDPIERALDRCLG